ncbi:DNA cytosine methyltransferase [Actinomadura sp. NTSP31]|uniref:DNA cytosine methyltransferase n=1 Tax=Actinomadura sp. NTSP31 TaxID=1735447 RepID=UPI0035C056CF
MGSAVRAVDLFAGAGGATAGLRQAGISVVGAVENDVYACQSYHANHPDVLLKEIDIRQLDPDAFRRELGLKRGSLELLKACPPCQGFSTLASGDIDEKRNDLVLDVANFAVAFRPRIILLENVPGLARDNRLSNLLAMLEGEGYRFRQYKVNAADLGVPQRRKRLIVIGASKAVRRRLPEEITDLIPEHFELAGTTVKDAFDLLRKSGTLDDPLDRHRQSSPQVAARIAAVPVNGSRFDLPPDLQLDCHRRVTGRTATASYGRIRLDAPAPTMTTRCTTPACGSFIHPTEHRGITLREAAILQTFPPTYQFLGHYGSIEQQIGNAVPVRMAAALGEVVRGILGQ